MMGLLKVKLVAKKIWLWAKKFWWALVMGLLLLVAVLVWALTKNGAYVASLLDLMETRRDAHDQEMETLAHIHNTEVAEKNARLKEHQRRMAELQDQFTRRGLTLDKQKKAELKRIVDEGYNDPEKLSREIAKAFGLEHG
tara:strand:+ start:3363 stop:3782 length:420 start_codon:yes stop_codon:yes gene_type:complete